MGTFHLESIGQENDQNRYLGDPPLVIQSLPVVALTDDQLLAISQINRDLRIERNARGKLIVQPPTGGDTSQCNAEIIVQLGLWAKQNGDGATFDSSGGFRLSKGAVRSPDAAWVRRSRLDALTTDERKKLFFSVLNF